MPPQAPAVRHIREGVLERVDAGDSQTLGRLRVGALELHTLEPPWRGNARGLSCIPEGEYRAEMRKSPRYGWRYWLQDTEPRTWVLIHPGNLGSHTRGCILPGLRLGRLNGQQAVLASRAAVGKLEEALDRATWHLTIRSSS